MIAPLSHFKFFDLIRFWIDNMHCASHARIKRMDRPDNFQRLVNFSQFRSDQGFFIGTA
jgi:hypothetical protein